MNRLKELIAIALKTVPTAIGDDASPSTTDGWDSIAHVLMVSLFEEEYGITFSAEEVADVQSLADFRRVLEEKGAAV
jgi:acyl carrier protein